MPERAYRLLHTFAQASNKKALRPEDWHRFFDFTLAVYHYTLPVTGWTVKNRLMGYGFSHEMAEQLSGEFDRYCELLSLHDRQRTS